MTKYLKNEDAFSQPEDVPATCHSNRTGPGNPDAQFMFLPAYTGQITPKNSFLSFEGNCFEKITMNMTYDEGANSVELVVETSGKRSDFCSDFFLIANYDIYHVEDFMMNGAHKLSFKLPNDKAAVDMEAFGLETYLFCESL